MQYKDIPHGTLLLDAQTGAVWIFCREDNGKVTEYALIDRLGKIRAFAYPLGMSNDSEVDEKYLIISLPTILKGAYEKSTTRR